MSAGRYRHRITIERPISGQDDYGAPIEGWEPIGTFAASIEPLTGREYIAAFAVQSEISTRLRLRYVAGILPSYRATYRGITYDVLSIINREMRNIELELMCKSSGRTG
jgi:SPP1 family predicted phage head-tail adaptor